MTRSMAWFLGGVLLAGGIYLGTNLMAAPVPLGTTTPTRVAMVNLRWVIKNYEGYKRFIDEMKKEEKKFIETMEQLQKQAESLTAAAQQLQGAAQEAKQREARDVQRQIEDLKRKVQKEVGQRSNDEMVKVYKEVRDAATRHAKANNFHLVLHFEGPADKNEVDSAMLVMRNINAGGCVPFYVDPELDISEAVLKRLNADPKGGDR